MYTYLAKFDLPISANRRDVNNFFIELSKGRAMQFKNQLNGGDPFGGIVDNIRWALPQTKHGNVKLEANKMLSKAKITDLNRQINDFMRDNTEFESFLHDYEYHDLEFMSKATFDEYKQSIYRKAKRIKHQPGLSEYKPALDVYKQVQHRTPFMYAAKTQFHGTHLRDFVKYMNNVPFHKYGPIPKVQHMFHGEKNHLLIVIASAKPLSKQALINAHDEYVAQFWDGAGEGFDFGGVNGLGTFKLI